ncbi:glycosyltransferase [Microbacterium foliorum]|nr:glycosyltransferase [Microbacterium foliorum]
MSIRSALLIVNYGSRRLLEENLARTAVPENMDVVIVDNLSTPEERAELLALSARAGWNLLSPASNLGFGGGMNLAASAAIARGAEVLVLLNPDAYIPEDGLARLVAAGSEPGTLVAPMVLRPDGGHFSSAMEVDLATGSLRRAVGGRRYAASAIWVSGACLAVGAELWNRVGGFDDDYFLYWEDVDLSVRVVAAGGRIKVDESIVAVHSPGGTQGGGRSKSAIYYRFNTRNRLVFAAKHVPPAAQRRWVRTAPKAAWDILLRGGRRQFVRPLRTLWPAARGTWEGWRFVRTAREAATRHG